MSVTSKFMGLALAATAAVGIASSASATTYYENAATGNFGATDIALGAFSHTFFVAPPLTFPSGVTSISAQTAYAVINAVITNNFDFSTTPGIPGLRLYDVTTNTYVDGIYTSPATGADQEWILSANVNAGDQYNIIVNGTGVTTGSRVDGSINFTAAPVPEPAAWLMMVGGFGMLGAALRRRGKTQVTFA